MYNTCGIAVKIERNGQSKELTGKLLLDAEHLEGRIASFQDDTAQFVIGNMYFLSNHQGIVVELAEVQLEMSVQNLPNGYYAVKKKDMSSILGKYYGKLRNDLNITINDHDSIQDIDARMKYSFSDPATQPIGSVEKITIELFYDSRDECD